MTEQQFQAMLVQHIKNLHIAKRHQKAGYQVPEDLMNAISMTHQYGLTHFSQNQQMQLDHYINQGLAKLENVENLENITKYRIARDQKLEKGLAQNRDLTPSGEALTVNQFRQLSQSADLKDVPTGYTKQTFGSYYENTHLPQMKSLAAVYGITVETLRERLDELVELEEDGNETAIRRTAERAAEYGISANLVDAWKEEGLETEMQRRMHMKDKKAAVNGHQTEHIIVSDQAERKVQIANALIDNGLGLPYDDSIRSDYLNDTGSRGDVARAMQAHEDADEKVYNDSMYQSLEEMDDELSSAYVEESIREIADMSRR